MRERGIEKGITEEKVGCLHGRCLKARCVYWLNRNKPKSDLLPVAALMLNYNKSSQSASSPTAKWFMLNTHNFPKKKQQDEVLKRNQSHKSSRNFPNTHLDVSHNCFFYTHILAVQFLCRVKNKDIHRALPSTKWQTIMSTTNATQCIHLAKLRETWTRGDCR